MARVKIWHNTRCTKSRQGLEFLREKEVEVEVIEYMKDGIDAAKLAGALRPGGGGWASGGRFGPGAGLDSI